MLLLQCAIVQMALVKRCEFKNVEVLCNLSMFKLCLLARIGSVFNILIFFIFVSNQIGKVFLPVSHSAIVFIPHCIISIIRSPFLTVMHVSMIFFYIHADSFCKFNCITGNKTSLSHHYLI